MIVTPQTTSRSYQRREVGSNKHEERITTVQDSTQLVREVSVREQQRSKDASAETILPHNPAHPPFAYPVWLTSQPGPQVTSWLPGQYPHPQRIDQMAYSFYDQERGRPCVPSPKLAVQTHRGRTSIPEESAREVASLEETQELWRDDDGTISPSLHAADALKA